MAESLSREQAESQAQVEANTLGLPVDVWLHVGGSNPAGAIPATGRHVTRPAVDGDGQPAPPPKWSVWQKVATKSPQ